MNADHRRENPGFLILGMQPKALIAAGLTLVGTAATALTLIVSAIHNATSQVKTIRDELTEHPPTTAEDLDRVQQRITDTTRQLREDVQDGIDQIDTTPQVTVVPPQPAQRPAQPRATPVPTPRPTPSPTPTPRLLPPLPPLLP